MKQLYFKIYLFSILFYLSGCVEDPEMSTKLQNASRPEVGNIEVVDSTATSLRMKAVVTSENGAPLKARGFRYWKEGEQEDFLEVKDTEKLGLGEYIKVIENLKNGAVYEITPFATNEVGTAFGDTINLNTTKGVGEVKTSDVVDENITATTARIEGILAKKGEGEITDFGFELYSNGGKDTTFRKSDGVDWGDNDSTFYYVVTGLQQETKYEVKAFAENSFGRFSHLSGKKEFTTKNGRPVLPVSVDSDADYDFIVVKSKLISKGDVEYEDVEVGFCWGTVAGKDRPNMEEDQHEACTLESDSFKLVLNDLDDSSYYIRAYAKNKFGTVYSEDSIFVAKKRDTPIVYLDDADTYTVKDGLVTISGKIQDKGKSEVTSLMLYYSTTSNPLPGPTNGEGIECLNYLDKDGKFIVPVKLLGGHTYYFRVCAKNNSGEAYGEKVQSITTPKIFIDKEAPFKGGGRQNFITFSLDNYAFVLGGQVGNEYTNNLYGYSLSSGSWTPLRSYKWNIEGGAVCSDGKSAYIIGGKTFTNITDVYSYSYNLWTQHPEMRLRKDMVGTLNAVSFAHKNSIVMIGGEKLLPDDTRGLIVQDSIYHWDGEIWNVAGTFPALVKGGVALTAGDSVIVGLGSISQDSIHSDPNKQLWINTTSEWDNWESLPEAPAKMGIVSTGVVKDSLLYFVDNKGIIWMYDLTESKWYECSQSPVIADQPEYRMMMINEDIYILALNNFGVSSFIIYDPTWDIGKE